MSQAVPYARAQRIRRNLRRRALQAPGRLRWHWSLMCAFGAGAALVLMMIGPMFGATDAPRTTAPSVAVATPVQASPPSRPSTPPRVPAADALALVVGGPTCDAGPGDLASEAGLHLRHECLITGAGVTLQSDGDVWIGGDAQALRLHEGRLHVHVDPRVARPRPFTIETPALRVEVTGTRFAVAHAKAGGLLELWEGSVRVTMASGETRTVSTGQGLRWSAEGSTWRVESIDVQASNPLDRGAAVAPSKAPRKPTTPKPSRPPKVDHAEHLVRELERLRERGKPAEAVALLERGLPGLHRRDAEILSFELGKLLERARGSHAACVHWAAYQESYPKGRYADLVDLERDRLRCSEPPP